MKLKIESAKIWVATQPVDFRRAIDGLCCTIVECLGAQPHEGVYIFYNRNKDKIKLIGKHRNGFVMLYKRLEKGKFPFKFRDESTKIEIDERKLSWLLSGLDCCSMSEWDDLTFDDYF